MNVDVFSESDIKNRTVFACKGRSHSLKES